MAYKDYRIYRPFLDKDKKPIGSACAIQLRKTKDEYPKAIIFLAVARQTGQDEEGNGKFDWQQAINVKLEVVDIAAFLAFIYGNTKEVKLYHQNNKGNTSVSLFPNERGGYQLRVARKEEGSLTTITQSWSVQDMAVLKVLFERYIAIFHEWK